MKNQKNPIKNPKNKQQQHQQKRVQNAALT